MRRITRHLLFGVVAAALTLSSCDVQSTIIQTNEQNNFFETPTPGEARPDINMVACRKQTTITYLVDKTQSGADAMLNTETKKLVLAMYELCPKSTVVTNFGSNGQAVWGASGKVIPFPEPSTALAFDEEANSMAVRKLCNARLRCMEAQLGERKKQHRTNQAKAEQDFKNAFAKATDSVVEEIIAPGQIEPRCYDMGDLWDRINNTDSDVVIVLTDGQHSCRSPLEARRFNSARKVIILLLPLENEIKSGAFEARRERLRTAFAGAAIHSLPATQSSTIVSSMTE